MTLKDLKDRCDTAKLAYQYGLLEEDTEPPFLYAVTSDSNNFIADDKVYKKIDQIELCYVYKVKDTTIEETIENTILDGVVWRKSDESYYADQRVWEIVYYFNI